MALSIPARVHEDEVGTALWGVGASNGILFKEIHTFTNFIEWQLIDSRDINIYFKKSIKNLLTNACAFPIILCIALCSLGQ